MTIIYIIIGIVLLVGIDQATKYATFFNLEVGQSVTAIENVLNFTFVTNRGAAFGLFSDARWVFMLGTSVLILGIVYLIAAKKIYHSSGFISATLVVAGGIGNMIDRLSIGYVIDFIDVNPLLSHIGLSFSVFNIADCCVCIGAFFMVLYIIFFHDKYKAKLEESSNGEKN